MIFKNGAILRVFRVKIAYFAGSTNPLGGGCYIHLTTEAYQRIVSQGSTLGETYQEETYPFIKRSLWGTLFIILARFCADVKRSCPQP